MNERTITVADTSIYIRESAATDESLPTLLCIHGNLGSGRWFEHVLDAYPGRAVAPDMPNFGRSDHIDDWSMPAYANWIRAIADALGTERAVILGHSLGGAVAMELLASHPELVERLILVDSSPIDGLFTPKEHYPAIEAYKADKAILAQALKTVVPMIKDEAFFAQLVDDAWKMNRDCFIGHAEELGKADFTTRLRGASVPVAVMRGAHDILITDEKAKALADFFGGTLETFATSGHSPMVEVPDEFAERVTALLRTSA
jgi:branched-chain amino acid transport system permease protein